jgi:imidazolonepropionase-like amidohydrolase
LDPEKVTNSLAGVIPSKNDQARKQSAMRKVETKELKDTFCAEVDKPSAKLVITGITKSFLDDSEALTANTNLTMVIDSGKIICFDTKDECASIAADAPNVHLENGHVLPGLTAVTSNLGLTEIWGESSTSDGRVKSSTNLAAEEVVYAKYGIHLDGKAFSRARIGGVTNAITAPRADGFAGGVSVGLKTSGKKTTLDGGIFKDEVALHFTVGQGSKCKYKVSKNCIITNTWIADSLTTVSAAVAKLRSIISDNEGKDNVYGRAANGSLPLVVYVENEVSGILSLLNQC